MPVLKLAGGILAAAALVAAAAWLWRTAPSDASDARAAAVAPPVVGAPPAPAAPRPEEPDPAGDAAMMAGIDGDDEWGPVKRHCPWPPEPSTWEVLDGPCLTAMNATRPDYDEWRRLLADAGGTRRAVVVALDDPQCRVPRGERRPDLYEACAAEAMVRLAELQRKCMERAHADWHAYYDRETRYSVTTRAETQEQFHGRLAQRAESLAGVLWRAYMCRMDMDALAWVEALPEPRDDLAFAGQLIYVPPTDDDPLGDGTGWSRDPELTQDAALYALARRLGAEVPEHLYQYPERAEWVPDDALPW